MNRLEALKALEAAVANDALHELPLRTQYKAVPADSSKYIDMAFKGSLDAAMKLHEAVLPDWEFCMTPLACDLWPGGAVFGFLSGEEPDFSISVENDASTARAWLLAIIRALITIEEAKSHE